MLFHSTRDLASKVTSKEAMLQGMAPDGGLYVPESIPSLPDRSELLDLDYRALAKKILGLWLTDFTAQELSQSVDRAYDDKFSDPRIVPVVETDEKVVMELFHGPTSAFKDMALTLLPHLLMTAARSTGEKREIVILTATSGDTGKAALEGFKDVEGTKICVFYPQEGVSNIQKRQMQTQEGQNVFVCGVEGDFDDCQTGIKKLFADQAFLEGLAARKQTVSSANSINIGRLVPQIVYYVWTYLRLVESGRIKNGDPVDVVVPTGNFGNILAAYYARKMGLPLGRLVCASNDNRVLTDVLETGVYDRNRDMVLTASPSMDILVSSNFERYLWEVSQDSDLVSRVMEDLKSKGRYEIPPQVHNKMDIVGKAVTQDQGFEELLQTYNEEGYLLDTHTAVASRAARLYRQEIQGGRPIVVSTASPYKFAADVLKALGVDAENAGDFEKIDLLAQKTGVSAPENILALESKEVRFTGVSASDVVSMRFAIEGFLGAS